MYNNNFRKASNAYQTALVHSHTSYDIWLKSLDFIARKLKEAKMHREQQDFESTHDCHARIQRVVSVLQNALPEAEDVAPNDPALQASIYVKQLYQDIRQTLTSISSKPNAIQLYEHLASQVTGLREHLHALSAQSVPVKAVEAMELEE